MSSYDGSLRHRVDAAGYGFVVHARLLCIQAFNFVIFLESRIRTELNNLMTSLKLDPKLTVKDVLPIYFNPIIAKTSD